MFWWWISCLEFTRGVFGSRIWRNGTGWFRP
jgi:hypothetical protein